MNIAIIPARGGSKRIPYKNIKEFCGKPLIAYSIEVAKNSELFDKILVSTDDEAIARVAKNYGAEVLKRPDELADDFTGTWDVINHALESVKDDGFEFACTIYATAPLLQTNYLKKGYEKLKNSDAINVFSATTMPFPIQRTFKVTADERCQMFTPEHYETRSQDLEEAYQDAGQFYWSKIGKKSSEVFFGKDSIPIILPRHLVQDIDTMEDFVRAESMYKTLFQNTFDKWNSTKQTIDNKKYTFNFNERDIYFISIGKNIGYEVYGKGDEFLRPVIVLKKFNNYSFLAIPLTSKIKKGHYYFPVDFQGRTNTALISQIKIIDAKRIKYKLGMLSRGQLKNLKKAVGEMINPS